MAGYEEATGETSEPQRSHQSTSTSRSSPASLVPGQGREGRTEWVWGLSSGQGEAVFLRPPLKVPQTQNWEICIVLVRVL